MPAQTTAAPAPAAREHLMHGSQLNHQRVVDHLNILGQASPSAVLAPPVAVDAGSCRQQLTAFGIRLIAIKTKHHQLGTRSTHHSPDKLGSNQRSRAGLPWISTPILIVLKTGNGETLMAVRTPPLLIKTSGTSRRPDLLGRIFRP